MNQYLTFGLFIGSTSFVTLCIDGFTEQKYLNSHKFATDILICHLNFTIWIVFVTLILIFYPSSLDATAVQGTMISRDGYKDGGEDGGRYIFKRSDGSRGVGGDGGVNNGVKGKERSEGKGRNGAGGGGSNGGKSNNFIELSSHQWSKYIPISGGSSPWSSQASSKHDYVYVYKNSESIQLEVFNSSSPPVTPPSPYRPRAPSYDNINIIDDNDSNLEERSPPPPFYFTSNNLLPPSPSFPQSPPATAAELLKYPSSPLSKSFRHIH